MAGVPQTESLSEVERLEVAEETESESLLLESGAVYSWGESYNGQLGLGYRSDTSQPSLIEEFSDSHSIEIIHVACGWRHTLFLSSTGTVYSCGWGAMYQLGTASGTARNVVVPTRVTGLPPELAISNPTDAQLDKVLQLAAGETFSAALLTSGRVLTWGTGNDGQLGLGEPTISTIPTLITTEHLTEPFPLSPNPFLRRKIIKIACGRAHMLALSDEYLVFGWGNNNHGVLCVEEEDMPCSRVPMLIAKLTQWRIVDISAGAYHCLAIAHDGGCVAWGNNEFGQLGIDEGDSYYCDPQLVYEKNATRVACGHHHSLILTVRGRVYSFGNNTSLQLGHTHDIREEYERSTANGERYIPIPTRIEALYGMEISRIAAGAAHSIALTNRGEVYFWGRKRLSRADVVDTPTPVKPLSGKRIVEIACGLEHTVAVTARCPTVTVPLSTLATDLAALVDPSDPNSTFADVALIAVPTPAGREPPQAASPVYAHRIVLFCRCENLQQVLLANMPANAEQTKHRLRLRIAGTDRTTLVLLLRFVYTDKLDLPPQSQSTNSDAAEAVQRIRQLARQWGVSDALMMCDAWLRGDVSSNAMQSTASPPKQPISRLQSSRKTSRKANQSCVPFVEVPKPIKRGLSRVPTLARDLRLALNNERFSDIQIEVAYSPQGEAERAPSNTVFYGHKCILVTRSSYFRAMFQHGMAEAAMSAVTVHDVRSDVFAVLLSYFVCDDLHVPPELAAELLVAATVFGAERLRAQCEKVLAAHVDVDNVCSMLQLADQHNVVQLRRVAVHLIREHRDVVVKSAGWNELTKELREEIEHALATLGT